MIVINPRLLLFAAAACFLIALLCVVIPAGILIGWAGWLETGLLSNALFLLANEAERKVPPGQ